MHSRRIRSRQHKERTRYTPPSGGGGDGSEPSYNAATDSLIFTDSFDTYDNVADGAGSLLIDQYPSWRILDTNQDVFIPDNQVDPTYVTLVTGRGGTGKALRCHYGIGHAGDIVIGTSSEQLGSVGGWNGTLPEQAGPYTHFIFSTWFRFSLNADPCNGAGGSAVWGVKGFMFWNHALNNRYESAVNRGHADEDFLITRGPKGCNPANSEMSAPYNTLYKTVNGRAPRFNPSAGEQFGIADGNWHRFTIELYCGNDPRHFGWTHWVDGTMVYSDIDIDVGPGTPPDHYDYSFPITHHIVFGNFPNAGDESTYFTVDFDDWMAWTN